MASLTIKKSIPLALTVIIYSISNVLRSCNAGEICNGEKYDVNDDLYEKGVRFVLGHLTTDTSRGGYDLYIASPGPPLYDNVYGHGFCGRDISPGDCDSCVEIAVSNLVNDCYLSVGAQIQLQDCRVRYEAYSFRE